MSKLKLAQGADGITRCAWGLSTADYTPYHDREWGFPVDDDRRLFEKICLEGFQSGLSWLTILRKRPAFRRAFRDFDVAAVARFNARSVERLMSDASIVRHRGKIEATVGNAKAAQNVVAEFGSLAAFFWTFEPRPHRYVNPPAASTPASVALSKELKRRGFRFVGPTTSYAFMQAMGLVNDHIPGCAMHAEAQQRRARFSPPAKRAAR